MSKPSVSSTSRWQGSSSCAQTICQVTVRISVVTTAEEGRPSSAAAVATRSREKLARPEAQSGVLYCGG